MESKFNDFINDINNIFINELCKCKEKFNKRGEKELFDDFIGTYSRAYKMMKNNKLVDGIIIARSSFEVLIVLIGIHINNNCYNEYFTANRYQRYIERKGQESKAVDYMSQSYLRKVINKRCKNVENDLNEMYGFLSSYAHPTVYRNVLINIEKEKINISKVYINTIMNILIIAFIICENLQILKYETLLDMTNLKLLIESLVSKTELVKINKFEIKEIENLMYKDINQDFYNKTIEEQKEELIKIQKEYEKSKLKIEKLIKKTINKMEYSNIYIRYVKIIKNFH